MNSGIKFFSFEANFFVDVIYAIYWVLEMVKHKFNQKQNSSFNWTWVPPKMFKYQQTIFIVAKIFWADILSCLLDFLFTRWDNF